MVTESAHAHKHACLDEIFDLLQSELGLIFNIKDKLIKSCERFDTCNFELVLNLLLLTKALNNYFVNCVILNNTPDCYSNFIETDMRKYTLGLLKDTSFFLDDNNAECRKLFLAMTRPLIDNLLATHERLVAESSDADLVQKKTIIDRGILVTVSVYFSCLSILYGLRFMTQKKIVFYFQPYFCDPLACGRNYFEILTTDVFPSFFGANDYDFVISYRLCSEAFLSMETPITLTRHTLSDLKQLTATFNNVFLSKVDNLTVSDILRISIIAIGIIYDDTVDEFGNDDNDELCVARNF